jgi:hypothetical protein
MPEQQLFNRMRDVAASHIGAFLARGLDGLGGEFEAQQFASTSPGEKKILACAIELLPGARRRIESAFIQALASIADRKCSPAGAGGREEPLSLDALTLVDDSAIELEIALGRLVRKTIEETDAEQYYGIEARVGEITAGRLVEGSSNPLGVETALEALKRACEAVPEDESVRMAIVNGLQPHVAAGLRQAYREINEQLAAAGIQPRLQYRVVRARDVGTKTEAKIPIGLAVSQTINLRDLLPVSTGSLVDIAAVIENMLAQPRESRRSGARILSNDKGMLYSAAVATPVDPVLVAALQKRQRVPGPAPVTALRELAPAAKHPLDRLTGDLMADVFEFMEADQALPTAVRAELARLPVAAFRAAMLDRTFFARPEHPLRRFLDEVSRVAADPETDASAAAPFVSTLRGVVDGLVRDFDCDLGVFETAGVDLAERAAAARAQEQVRLQEQIAALERAEREEATRERASAFIATRLGPETPGFVRRFLEGVWPTAVAVAEIEGRTGDDRVDRRLALVDDLLWSVETKQPPDVPRLVRLLPRLVPALGRGMDDAATDASVRQAFLDELMRTHTAMLQTARSAKASAAPAPAPRPALAPDVTLPYSAGMAPTTAASPALITRGRVVELRSASGAQRAKLSWVSPQGQTYVFTSNQAGARSFTREQLVRGLECGSVRLVETEPTAIERALAAVSR